MNMKAVTLMVVSAMMIACGSEKPVVHVRQTLCDLQSPPAGCSQSCSAANPFCSEGFYCGNDGHCTAECSPTDNGFCDVGQLCSPSGRCVSPSDSSGSESAQCVETKIVATQPTLVNLMILVDRSGSMSGFANPTGETRWGVVQNFLLGPSGFLTRMQSNMRMSLSTYYSLNATCPNMPAVAAPALQQATVMAANLGAPVGGAQTPTAEALIQASDALRGHALSGPNLILLITDGEPTGCSGTSPTDEARQATIDAAKNAFDAGILTYVVGVGSEVSDNFLATLAGAGQGLATGAVLRAGDPASLASAFNAALYPNLSCVVELQGDRITPGTECEGQVFINGESTPLPCNSELGWRLLDETHIELSADACYRYKTSANLNIEATFPCSSLVITL
jgi:hypothetical protein